MAKFVVVPAAIVGLVLFALPARAGMFEVTETMMAVQGNAGLFMGSVFGPDNSTTLQFSSQVDPVTRSFSFASLPGQTYLGQPFSLSSAGSYNSVLGKYLWTTDGQLGSQSWMETGTAQWVGDPTGTFHGNQVLGGVRYAIDGTAEVDGMGHSEGQFTFTSPNGTQFGPYPGTDYVSSNGDWIYTIQVPRNPITPNGIVTNAMGNIPFPNGGIGNFDFQVNAQPASTPEPSSLALLGVGAFSLLGYGWRRWRQSPA